MYLICIFSNFLLVFNLNSTNLPFFDKNPQKTTLIFWEFKTNFINLHQEIKTCRFTKSDDAKYEESWENLDISGPLEPYIVNENHNL